MPTRSQSNNLKLPSVELGQPNSSFVALATSAQKEGLVEARRCQRSQPVCKIHHRWTEHAAEQMVQIGRMLSDSLNDFRIGVADQTGHLT